MRRVMVGAVCAAFVFSGGLEIAAAGGDMPVLQAGREAIPAETQVLLNAYPGLQYEAAGSAIRSFHSVPMTSAETPEEAAEAFWVRHGGAFGIENLGLQLLWSNDLSFGRFTVFAYSQQMAGLTVESSVARVLVRSGDPQQVVLASGVFAQPPAGGFAPIAIIAEQALSSVQAMPEYAGLSIWTAPEMVVYAGTGEELTSGAATFGPPVRAWKFVGDNGNLANRARMTFYVDAANGVLVGTRNEIIHTDVSGTVQGKGTPGTRPDIAANPPTALNIAEMRISITGGNNALSDRSGAFTIANGGTADVTLTSNVSAGPWVNVNTQSGSEITVSQTVTPPGPAALMYNNSPSAANTAQVNAFICTTAVHDFVKDRTSWTGLDLQIPANVNLNQTCNAYFDGSSINFFLAGGGCPNSAYSTVVAHEYGHFVVARQNLSQGAFGEGLGDAIAMLEYNDPVVARDFFGSTPIRDYSPGVPEDPYPCPGSCSGEVHCCGETLAGLWWDVREQIGLGMGEPAGLEYSQQLFVDWLQITAGGQGNNSAHPQTVIEILTVDDTDGNLLNGSPNYNRICAAASAHSLSCPTLVLAEFRFPNGLPAMLTPDQPNGIRVDVVGVGGIPTPGSGTLSYSVNGGAFETIPMEQGNPNEYTAWIPPVPCDREVRYYFRAQTDGGPVSSPGDAPASSYSALVASGLVTLLHDDFETDLGWSVDPADTATTGRWSREDPQPTTVQPADDHTPAPGTICWVTDGRAGSLTAMYDVDGGRTSLISPVLDLSSATGATAEFWLWYTNHHGGAPYLDVFRVDMSNDGGATWTNALTVGPAGARVQGGWYAYTVHLGSVVPLTATVRLRFVAEDAGADSLVEAALDDFRIFTLECGQAPCPADLDGDLSIGLQDLTILLANFGTTGTATPEQGDLDGDQDVDLADLAALLAAFGTACP